MIYDKFIILIYDKIQYDMDESGSIDYYMKYE